MIKASAIANPGIATGNTIVSSIILEILPPILANTYAAGIPIINVNIYLLKTSRIAIHPIDHK